MSKIDGYPFKIPTSPVLKALQPVHSASGARDPARRASQQQLVTAALPKTEVRDQLETRAELLRRGSMDEGGSRGRNLSVVNTYLSLQVNQEREEISRLIGVDVYA